MAAVGRATMFTVLAPDELLHPVLFVTFTEIVSVPDLFATKMMLLLLLPAVMDPPAIVQAYTAPDPAFATQAILPDEPAHTEDGAVMLATG